MERKSTLVVGAPRRGKTFLCEKIAVNYAKKGGTAIAYNVGRDTDFEKFIRVNLITPKHRQMMARDKGIDIKNRDIGFSITHFEVDATGEVYLIEDFMKIFSGKCVKIERLNPAFQEERMFFLVIYKYFYNCLIVMDDFRAVTRYGLSAEFLQLNSRQNHCGKSYAPSPNLVGVDIFFVYHSFESVAQEMYTYTNSTLQFFTNNQPQKISENMKLYRMYLDNYNTLQASPKYSHFQINTIEYQQNFVNP